MPQRFKAMGAPRALLVLGGLGLALLLVGDSSDHPATGTRIHPCGNHPIHQQPCFSRRRHAAGRACTQREHRWLDQCIGHSWSENGTENDRCFTGAGGVTLSHSVCR